MPSLRTVDAVLLLAVLGSSAAFVPASIPCMMRDRRGVVAGTSRHHHHQSACRATSSGDGNDENIISGGVFAKHAAKVGCSARVLSRMRMSQPGDQSGSAAGKGDDTAEGDGSTMPSFYFSRRLDETGGVNLQQLYALFRNQVLVGVSALFTINSMDQSGTPLEIAFQITPSAVVLAVVASAPIVALGYLLSRSSNKVVADLNYSTDVLVLGLLGKDRNVIPATAVSCGISALTGVCEELSFRAVLLPILASRLGSGGVPDVEAGLAASTLSFAVAHLSFGGGFKDNLVTLLLQTVTGFWFGAVFVVSGFNLFAPAAVHAVYDAFTLLETHVRVTGQIEYAEQQASGALEPADSSDSVWGDVSSLEDAGDVQRGFERYLRVLFYMSDSDRDGVIDKEELGVALRQFGRDLSPGDIDSVFERALGDASVNGLSPAQFARIVLLLRGDQGLGRASGDKGEKRGLIGLR